MTPLEMHEHAHALAQEGHLERAIELATAALAGLRTELGEDSTQLAVVLTNLGSFYAELERWGDALPYYQDGLARKVHEYGDDDPTCANTLFRIARCHAGLGDAEAAVSAYRQAIAIFNRHPESNAVIHHLALAELLALAAAADNRE